MSAALAVRAGVTAGGVATEGVLVEGVVAEGVVTGSESAGLTTNEFVIAGTVLAAGVSGLAVGIVSPPVTLLLPPPHPANTDNKAVTTASFGKLFFTEVLLVRS